VLVIIDDALAEQVYLVGDVLSACDYYLFMLALWALPFEKAPLSYQHLGPYLRRLSTLSVVIQTCEFEEIDISAFQS
jgi:glutathione S-transferase